MDHHVLINLCVIFGLTSVVIVICNLLKIKYIIGYLLTGVLLSPHTTNMFTNMEEVKTYAEIGIILLLFTVGLEFSFDKLMKIKKYVFVGGLSQVVFTIVLTGVLIVLMMGTSLAEGTFWGFLYALSSTAIVIKLLQDNNKLVTPQGKFILAVLLFQDIVIVPLMLLVPIIAGEADNPWLSLALLTGKLVLMLAISYALSKYIVPFIMKLVMDVKSQEVFLITIVFLVTGIALLTEQLGLSLALGAFIAGLIIADTEYRHVTISCVLPFRYVFMSFFFISMGMLLDYRIFIEEPGWIVFWLVFAFVVKAIAGYFSARTLKLGIATSITAGLSIAQIGEFSFVLAQEGLSHHLISDHNYQLFLAVSIILMSLTPFIFDKSEWVGSKIEAIYGKRKG